MEEKEKDKKIQDFGQVVLENNKKHGKIHLMTIIGEIDGKAVNMLITIDSTTAYLNGEKIELDSAAFITDSRTYLPLRFICESLSAEVEWLKDTQKIIITAK